MRVTRHIDHDLYPRKAITEARAAFREYCTLQITPAPSNSARIEINVAVEHEEQAREIVLEFLNYALDKAVEMKLREI